MVKNSRTITNNWNEITISNSNIMMFSAWKKIRWESTSILYHVTCSTDNNVVVSIGLIDWHIIYSGLNISKRVARCSRSNSTKSLWLGPKLTWFKVWRLCYCIESWLPIIWGTRAKRHYPSSPYTLPHMGLGCRWDLLTWPVWDRLTWL